MPEGARRRSDTTADRLGRMLVVVPYLVQHPGTTLTEAADLFGVDPVQLRRDLDLLFLSGLPPYGPGDLIDVEIDEDGADLDPHGRSLLAAAAAHATGGSGRPPAGAPSSWRRRGCPRRRPWNARSTSCERPSAAPRDRGGRTGAAPRFLPGFRDAAQAHRRVRIDYVAASSGERSWRQIDPEAVFASLGRWYAAAWDVDADAERLFRIDRVAGFEPDG